MGQEKLFKEIPTRRSTDKNFGSLEETATLKVPVNLEHSRYLGVLRSCDQQIPGPFPARPPSQGKGLRNEVVLKA